MPTFLAKFMLLLIVLYSYIKQPLSASTWLYKYDYFIYVNISLQYICCEIPDLSLNLDRTGKVGDFRPFLAFGLDDE